MHHIIVFYTSLTLAEKLAQVMGICASVALAIAPHFSKSDKQENENNKAAMIFFQNVAYGFYMLQYMMLKAYTPVVTNIITLVRGRIFGKYVEKRENIPFRWLAMYCMAIGIAGIVTYQNPMSLVPIVMCWLDGWGTWSDDKTVYPKVSVIRSAFWCIYNAFVKAYVGSIGNAGQFISAIIAVYNGSKK